MSGSVSPLPWTGNKGCIYTTIDAFMPPHKTYVEACMGSAEVFLRKRPVEREIINDFNGDLVRFFRVLQRNENLQKLLYAFTPSQNNSLDDLLAEEETLRDMLGDLSISSAEAAELLASLPPELSQERRRIVQQALSLVGKVNYFWGGKSLVIGWDSRWGRLTEVTAAGSPTTGTFRPYGLDCSGFADWVFYNVSGGSYILGHGGGVISQHQYCVTISWSQAQPGDLVFYPEDSHIGIVGGWDVAGNIQIIHCASGNLNNVVITGKSGFTTVGRPYYYGE